MNEPTFIHFSGCKYNLFVENYNLFFIYFIEKLLADQGFKILLIIIS